MLMSNATLHYGMHEDTEAIVIFNPVNRLYYHLDEIAAYVWQLVRSPMTLSEICAAIQDRYDVEPESCESDIQTLLQELECAGLIEVAGD